MAPRKEKSEKASADQASDLILQYLRKQKWSAILGMFVLMRVAEVPGEGLIVENEGSPCIPQATDISSNLHNKVTKTHAAKTLKEMQERNEIVGRAAGKQSVYHVFQDPNDAASPEEFAAMDVEISTLKEETTTLKADEKALRSTLSTLKTTLSTHDLREAVHALELELKTIEARLSPLRSGNVVPVSAEERALVEKEWREVKRVVEVRRKGCMSLWADLSEQLPEGTTMEELWERLGLEDDP
ncbi:MAG: hypothetical protein M1836_000048 [Candelina mexicana]|nr:MAG: hypothetical protein M1836_000048 [Candelina mexicana]